MATNWNAVLANINNASDILAILRKILPLLDGKVDGTTLDEILTQLNKVAEDGEITIQEALETINLLEQKILDRTSAFDEAIEAAAAAGAGSNGWTADLVAYAGSTQKQFNDSQNNLNLTIINYVNPKMFGAKGDGVTDDAQAIRNCFIFMVANKATFNDPSYSEYLYNSNILVNAPNQKLVISGNCKFISENNYITFSGTKEQLGYISFSASRNSKTITLNQNAVLNKGDLIAIHNSRVSSLSSHESYYYDGEYKTVEASSGNVITLESMLETSYPAGIQDKVWKVNPIILDIRGVKFKSSGLSAIKISLSAYSYFDFNSENPSTSSGAQNSFNLDRSYSSYIAGGRHIKVNLSGSGTDYGIIIGNSQDILVEADYVFGARHGCAIGGDDTDMAAPNRRIHCEKMTIENSPTSLLHAADMHGNTIDCHYRDNYIKGRISLSGRNPKAINNKIHVHPGDIRVPIGLSQLIGGRVESINNEVVTSGGASYILGWLASSTIQKASEPTTLVLQDIKFEGNPNMVGILAAFNLPVSSNVILDGFELVGSAPIFDRLLNYSAGASAVKPSFIQITRPKFAVPDSIILIAGDAGLAGVAKQVFPSSGTTESNGSWIRNSDGTMECTIRVTATLPVTTTATGGFKTADIQWTYPKPFVAQPRLSPMIFDNVSVQIKATSAGTSSAKIYSFSNISVENAGINFDITAKGKFLY
ncbi:hypothetical protein F935_01517 [Acinetobacter calcoaceticus ANC 3811]|uniref:Gp49 pectin lyase-like domain-containing protein n=1 Tax=Acinetobacter calcoaceticus ANC 3811 TaxID=1217690 RepID=R8Y8U7_ACICA|nr:hypothetical protein [Acinetobacter calcoaceticus]EOQ63887.1 hypothetical protein F935_01517 [Acinetobacter calcoaceticus ANC 3811]